MPTDRLILAIDQGTSNTKAVLVDTTGVIVGQASRPMDIEYPQPGWVQQDPAALWQAVRACIDEVLEAAGDPGLAAIGISNQRESGVAWERAGGAPLGPVVTWQCRRSGALCEWLRGAGRAHRVSRRARACRSIPASPRASGAGSWMRPPTGGRARATETSAWARWTAGCCGT